MKSSRSRRLAALRFGLGLTALAALALRGQARADPGNHDRMGWEPGTLTTASLEGEVAPRDDGRDHDGVYGRLDGDLFLSVGAGAELGGGTRAGGMARALFFQSVGVHFGFAEAVADSVLERVVFMGAELRPLFLPRLALDLEGAGPLLDLTLDSLSVGAGVCFAAEQDEAARALELSAGFGVPLLMTARGPWLEARGALRPGLDAESGQLFLLLSWYEAIETPLVR